VKTLRRWKLDHDHPYCTTIAADARLATTRYADDQSWELSLGAGESTALALQTHYGGRAGLVSIVPLWQHEGRVVHQYQAYAVPPMITAFAPGYLRVQASLNLQLAVQIEYWVMDSNAVGAKITLSNAHDRETEVTLDLLGVVGLNNREQKIAIIPLEPDEQLGMALGKIGNLEPVVRLEGAASTVAAGASTNKLTRKVSIGGRKKAVIRWVHAGLSTWKESARVALKWLEQDWAVAFGRIEAAGESIPQIETGDEATDVVLAFATQQLVQGFVNPPPALPFKMAAPMRVPERGFSLSGDGSDMDRAWGGTSVQHIYLAATSISPVNAELAQGLIRNYLATQKPDGWIDWKPGQPALPTAQPILCPPILARTAWTVFQYTEDATFLRECLPKLMRFFNRWLSLDRDVGDDGLPEWQMEAQMGYSFLPTFGAWQPWGQGADINTVDSPDLFAYLLSEARSLHEIAYFLQDEQAQADIKPRIERLTLALESLWNPDLGRYAYRDRDTHLTQPGQMLFSEARGLEIIPVAAELNQAARILLRVRGGTDTPPGASFILEGADTNGNSITEVIDSGELTWVRGQGVATSNHTFTHLDQVKTERLSRVYTVDVLTVDTTLEDLTQYLPLWSGGISPERAQALMTRLTDPGVFWRTNGLPMCAASDPNYDPSNANGCGGIWPYWNTLIAEALIEHGAIAQATDLYKRLVHVQAETLRTHKGFREFYHAEAPEGLGERRLSGIPSLHLLLRVLGVRIISPTTVWTGGPFHWGSPVKITQHGVTVERSAAHTTITFPGADSITIENGKMRQITAPPTSAI
jgi:hypothetical protein